MSRSIFTPEELEELRRADAEIEAGFVMTREERMEIKRRDKKPRKVSEESRLRNIERSKAYYREHREEILAYQKDYYREHREEMRAVRREYQRTYYATHREEKPRVLNPENRAKISERNKAYYRAHRDKILARGRARRAAAKSMIKQEGEGNHGAELHESLREI